MTLKERCIEAGRDALGRNDGWRWWAPRHLGKLFDVWYPMIYADALEFCCSDNQVLREDAEKEIRKRLLDQVTVLKPDEFGRVSKGLVQAMIMGEVE